MTKKKKEKKRKESNKKQIKKDKKIQIKKCLESTKAPLIF